MRTLLSSLMSFLLLLSIGCNREVTDRRHRFRVTIENGIEIATTTGGPKFDGELFRYEHILTLKEDPENDESLLSHPLVFTRDETGMYYVLDTSQRRIAVFDNSGRFVRSIGRRGHGPGEFATSALQYVRNGVISILDWQLSRVTRFSTGGQLIDIVQKPPDFTYVPRGILHTGNGGLMVFQPFIVGSCSTRVKVCTYRADGRLLATIESPRIRDKTELQDPATGRQIRAEIPYAPITTAVYRPGGEILLSPAHEPVLEWYDVEGTVKRRIVIACLDNGLSEEARERFARLWEERLARFPERRADVRLHGAPSLLPETIPYWTFVHVDDAGYYWLRLPDPVYQDYIFREGYRYHVLNPEGEYLGITRTPPEHLAGDIQWHLIPVSVTHGYYMGITDDPDSGGKLMKVYRLVPVAEGFRYPI